ncbi:hypothetical protein GCM10011578_043070 [Streptomyces fuscichromogenes]|uniref:Uncharacterized protein n=1 Tax=Streptomyces fuscichromogenes TaxID=1324013 RepID=A0A917XEV8_9ACTN|nr:hypothetical protein GCM10011578_043070 [Streptomyces fuscichromogenes]
MPGWVLLGCVPPGCALPADEVPPADELPDVPPADEPPVVVPPADELPDVPPADALPDVPPADEPPADALPDVPPADEPPADALPDVPPADEPPDVPPADVPPVVVPPAGGLPAGGLPVVVPPAGGLPAGGLPVVVPPAGGFPAGGLPVVVPPVVPACWFTGALMVEPIIWLTLLVVWTWIWFITVVDRPRLVALACAAAEPAARACCSEAPRLIAACAALVPAATAADAPAALPAEACPAEPVQDTGPTVTAPVPVTAVGPIRPSEEEVTLFPPGETVNVPLGAKLSPVRVPPVTRHVGFEAAEATSVIPVTVPLTSAAITAAPSAVFPSMNLSLPGFRLSDWSAFLQITAP